ncbi:hypothetical protein OQA88_13051 [Cercophora sp. LCS_1]
MTSSVFDRPSPGSVKFLAGGLIRLRGASDNLPQQWWFASTAIPLIAATIGPLSNVLSIVSLVSPWRLTLPGDGTPSGSGRGSEDAAIGIADPKWELIANGFSLALGFAGNILLLLHFTSRVRYIIALPLATLCWLLSSIILIAIEIAMALNCPPQAPLEVYSQGFWHAVLASILYLIGSTILLINIAGYLRGHYPQQFDLDDSQRALILQTTAFFFWLAGGSAMFCLTEGFTYADALYFAEVSVLTVGFGDFAPATDPGRGFLFVFQFIGIIFLGLVISSITKFASNISADKIIKQHQLHARESTVGRTVTCERELRERLGLPPRSDLTPGSDRRSSLAKYGKLEIVGRTITFHENKHPPKPPGRSKNSILRGRETSQEKRKRTRQKLLLLQREKDRFEAMRQIQRETKRYKQYWALGMALLAFGVLWCLGAFVFFVTEKHILGLRYFECFYFCFVALLTIGYGDISPKSNIGKPFFVVWSLVAVPVVTLLVQEMAKTVVEGVNRGVWRVADLTRVMPRLGKGGRTENGEGLVFSVPDYGEEGGVQEVEGNGDDGRHHDLARELAVAIKSVAHDLRALKPRKYTYEEWARFTRLIRFSRRESEGEGEEGELVEWDWIGEDSPMLADITEAEWVLDRLCESLNRYTRRQADARRVESEDGSSDTVGGRSDGDGDGE